MRGLPLAASSSSVGDDAVLGGLLDQEEGHGAPVAWSEDFVRIRSGHTVEKSALGELPFDESVELGGIAGRGVRQLIDELDGRLAVEVLVEVDRCRRVLKSSEDARFFNLAYDRKALDEASGQLPVRPAEKDHRGCNACREAVLCHVVHVRVHELH